jgi:uncharacterized membrane protein YdbT with pleckstrin-like domain
LTISVIVIAIGVALDFGIPHTSVESHWIEGSVVAIPCLWLAARVLRWRTTSFVVTSVRIIEQWGVMSYHQSETMLSHIVSVTATQTLLRRVVGTGRIEFEILGDDQIRWIDDVPKPMILRRVINRRLPPFPSDPDPGWG